MCSVHCLHVARGGANGTLRLPQDPGRPIKLFPGETEEDCHTMRFYTGSLLSFDFPLNFLRSNLAAPYVPCSLLRFTHESKGDFDFPRDFEV